jgi:hypothetical protein
MKRFILACWALGAGLALVNGGLIAASLPSASGGPGIYALIEKVVLEPDGQAPERVQLWGAFMVPRPMSSFQYLPAQRGYLYFRLVRGQEEIGRREWADLKSVAGTGVAVGFANYWVPNPTDPRAGNPHSALVVHVHRGDEPVSAISADPILLISES